MAAYPKRHGAAFSAVVGGVQARLGLESAFRPRNSSRTCQELVPKRRTTFFFLLIQSALPALVPSMK